MKLTPVRIGDTEIETVEASPSRLAYTLENDGAVIAAMTSPRASARQAKSVLVSKQIPSASVSDQSVSVRANMWLDSRAYREGVWWLMR